MFLVWISIHFLNLSSLSESANLLRFIILMASIVQRFYPVPLDNRRLRVLNQGRAGWLSSVAIVWLDGEFTTTSFSHIRMQIVNEDYSDSWVEGEDFYSRDVRHEEVYEFSKWFLSEWDWSWPNHTLTLRNYLLYLQVEKSKGNSILLGMPPLGAPDYVSRTTAFDQDSSFEQDDESFLP